MLLHILPDIELFCLFIIASQDAFCAFLLNMLLGVFPFLFQFPNNLL